MMVLDHAVLIRAHSPSQSTEDVLHIGVVSAGFRDGDAQLSVTQRSDGRDDSCDDPDDQSHAHWAGVFQHSLRTDEDTWANDVTWWMGDRGKKTGVRRVILVQVQ